MSQTVLRRLAPAKVNLFLHVGPPMDSGYHPLSSLVVFADVGDVLTARPASSLALAVEGPFAASIDAGPGNLVIRALKAIGEAAGIGDPPLSVTLDKRLPVAAGLGGGSSDAGAALHLARQALGLPVDDEALERIALEMGADGPMCLWAKPALAEGRGERLKPAPALPDLHAVLVNPGAPSATPAVYRAYDEDGPRPLAPERLPKGYATVAALCDDLMRRRNDLEAPAIRLEPSIGERRTRMMAAPGVRLTRVSGSGATVFGLFDSAEAAATAAGVLAAGHPQDWVVACRLGAVDCFVD